MSRILLGKVLAWVRGNAAELVRDGAGLAGGAMVSIGAAQIYGPAGWIVGGVLLMAGALATARAKARA